MRRASGARRRAPRLLAAFALLALALAACTSRPPYEQRVHVDHHKVAHAGDGYAGGASAGGKVVSTVSDAPSS